MRRLIALSALAALTACASPAPRYEVFTVSDAGHSVIFKDGAPIVNYSARVTGNQVADVHTKRGRYVGTAKVTSVSSRRPVITIEASTVSHIEVK